MKKYICKSHSKDTVCKSDFRQHKIFAPALKLVPVGCFTHPQTHQQVNEVQFNIEDNINIFKTHGSHTWHLDPHSSVSALGLRHCSPYLHLLQAVHGGARSHDDQIHCWYALLWGEPASLPSWACLRSLEHPSDQDQCRGATGTWDLIKNMTNTISDDCIRILLNSRQCKCGRQINDTKIEINVSAILAL